MIDFTLNTTYPSVQALIDVQAASRIHAKDASLYDFSEQAQDCAQNYMGWADLASNPPSSVKEIQDFAWTMYGKGVETVVFIGQGGSTQAPMTLTKYNKQDSSFPVSFKTIDSVSPVRIRTILAGCDPETMLVIQASKSGGTIEPRLVMQAVRAYLADFLPEEEIPSHLVAVTDPGSDLEKQAKAEGWERVFLGEPTVGGRYSALSVFGLLPAALAGIDIQALVEHAREAEELCARNCAENPAIQLASFLYDNYCQGRDKFTFLSPKRGRVLGLWIEQLVAESVGKNGLGILPNIEIDALTLAEDPGDRVIVAYNTKIDLFDEQQNCLKSLEYVSEAIPQMTFNVEDVYDLSSHFIMWEYATAMLGYLMKVCPFDQPDVAAAKAKVLNILAEGGAAPTFVQDGLEGVPVGQVEVYVSEALQGSVEEQTIESALRALVSSIKPGDYYSANAFVPFAGEGRREAMEEIRHAIMNKVPVASCLEIGPRYLHSTGQLQKGGPNNGVFLIISTNEARDIPIVNEPAQTLGELAKAQAMGDFAILSERGRRCVHVHLPDNSSITLRMLAKTLKKVCI